MKHILALALLITSTAVFSATFGKIAKFTNPNLEKAAKNNELAIYAATNCEIEMFN